MLSSSQLVYTQLFIMGDYLQFIGTELLLNTWSSDVLTHCKRLFDHHGIPDELTTEISRDSQMTHFSISLWCSSSSKPCLCTFKWVHWIVIEPCLQSIFFFTKSKYSFKYKNWAISSKPCYCVTLSHSCWQPLPKLKTSTPNISLPWFNSSKSGGPEKSPTVSCASPVGLEVTAKGAMSQRDAFPTDSARRRCQPSSSSPRSSLPAAKPRRYFSQHCHPVAQRTNDSGAARR